MGSAALIVHIPESAAVLFKGSLFPSAKRAERRKERINPYLVYLFFVYLYLVPGGFPDAACPYPENPDAVKPDTKKPDVAAVLSAASVHSLFSGGDEP